MVAIEIVGSGALGTIAFAKSARAAVDVLCQQLERRRQMTCPL
jgi:hypothetical protein